MKTLHSKMLLCDVLQQNEVLAAQKAAVKQLHKQQDRVHHERLVQQVQVGAAGQPGRCAPWHGSGTVTGGDTWLPAAPCPSSPSP